MCKHTAVQSRVRRNRGLDVSREPPIPPQALVEPVPIQDVFVSGIGEIEIIGPCARFILYVDQHPIGDGDIAQERVVVAKIVMPMEAIQPAIGLMMLAS